MAAEKREFTENSDEGAARPLSKAKTVDVWAPFRPLLIPLTGVHRKVLFTRGDQSVFLMGEVHSLQFERPGKTPLPEIIESYLETAEGVDFMLEMTNDNSKADFPDIEETRAIVKGVENRPYANRDESDFILQLVRHLVDRFVPKGKHKERREYVTIPNGARVHWLEPQEYESRGATRDETLGFDPHGADDLNYLFAKFQSLKTYTDTYTDPRAYPLLKFLLDDINVALKVTPRQYAKLQLHLALPLHQLPGSMVDVLLRKCVEGISRSKFFRKCFLDDERHVDYSIYSEAFFRSWVARDPDEGNVETLYYNIQRFFVDIFTICRILKGAQEASFKKIVVYGGSWHIENLEFILNALRYEKHEVESATGGKRRKKKTRIRKRCQKTAAASRRRLT